MNFTFEFNAVLHVEFLESPSCSDSDKQTWKALDYRVVERLNDTYSSMLEEYRGVADMVA